MAIITIDEILANETLRRSNRYAQVGFPNKQRVLRAPDGICTVGILEEIGLVGEICDAQRSSKGAIQTESCHVFGSHPG